MARKGSVLRFKVDYRYPNGIGDRISKETLGEAEQTAGEIARRGAEVTVSYKPDKYQPVQLIEAGPDVGHELRLGEMTPRPGMVTETCGEGFICSCGRQAGDRRAIEWHFRRFGLCSICLGTGAVPGAAGGPDAGRDIECPVCSGTGDDGETSFWGVDMALFVDRIEALRVSQG